MTTTRVTALLLCLLLSGAALAASENDNSVGTVIGLRGLATINRSGQTLAAAMGRRVATHDWLRTGRESSLKVHMDDGTIINLGPSVQMSLSSYQPPEEAAAKPTLLKLVTGTLRLFVSKVFRDSDSGFYVRTPTAVAGVRGTYFLVSIDEKRATEVDVINGRVELTESQMALDTPTVLQMIAADYDQEFKSAVEITPGKSSKVRPAGTAEKPYDSNDEAVKERLESASTPSSLNALTRRDGGWVGGAVTGLSPENYEKSGALDLPSAEQMRSRFGVKSYAESLGQERERTPAGPGAGLQNPY